MPNFYLDFLLFLTLEEMTIKHLIYTQKVPLNGTERDCVIFSHSEIRPGRKVMTTKVLQFLRVIPHDTLISKF